MKYLRYIVDVEADHLDVDDIATRNEIEDTLTGVIDNEYSAWVEFSEVVND